MIACGLRLDEQDWQESLDAAGATPPYGFEVPVSLLESCPRFVQRFELGDLNVVNIREVLPPEQAPYLDECPLATREGLVRALAATLELGRCFGAACATVDLGLDRVRDGAGLDHRETFLSSALTLPEGPMLCMQVRAPRRFPKSQEWHLARELASRLASPRLGIAVNVAVHDISPQPAPAELREWFDDRLRLVRFQLDGPCPKCLESRVLLQWADELATWESPPMLVLCVPRRGPEMLASLHQAVAHTVRALFGS